MAEAVIADHNDRPRNWGDLPLATHQAEGYDPFCGDRYTIRLRVTDGRVSVASFHGFGCSISKASASMLTDLVQGLQLAEVKGLAERVERAFLSGGPSPAGDIQALLPIRSQPSRIKCVLLPWRALLSALQNG